jgi:hypothetical protein
VHSSPSSARCTLCVTGASGGNAAGSIPCRRRWFPAHLCSRTSIMVELGTALKCCIVVVTENRALQRIENAALR